MIQSSVVIAGRAGYHAARRGAQPSAAAPRIIYIRADVEAGGHSGAHGRRALPCRSRAAPSPCSRLPAAVALVVGARRRRSPAAARARRAAHRQALRRRTGRAATTRRCTGCSTTRRAPASSRASLRRRLPPPRDRDRGARSTSARSATATATRSRVALTLADARRSARFHGTLELPVSGNGDAMRIAWRAKLVFPGPARRRAALARDVAPAARRAARTRRDACSPRATTARSSIPRRRRRSSGGSSPPRLSGALRALGYPTTRSSAPPGSSAIFEPSWPAPRAARSTPAAASSRARARSRRRGAHDDRP